jgi:hypothetical protein
MTKLFYGLEDVLEDAAHAPRLPRWMRRIVRSIGRTFGETGGLLASHRDEF